MNTGRHDEALRNLLADLPAGQEPDLFHLLTCPLCHGRASARLGEQEGKGERPDYTALWGRLEADVPRLIERAGQRYAEAEALLADLLSYPEHEQAKALREDGFQSFFLLEQMLDRSHAAQPHDLERSERLAALATVLAARLHRRKDEAEEAALCLARAECLAGNARRLSGRWGDADASFGRAVDGLARAWGQSSESAIFCRSLGLLRWEQGRLDEAESLLRQGARIFGELESGQEEAASRILLGLLSLEGGRPERAVRLLQAGRAVLDPAVRPWMTVRAGLSAGIGFAELGQADQARAVLEESWRSYLSVNDEREVVRLSWLEGKLYARLGQREHAEPLLAVARRNLLAEYSLPEAVLCTLDLAALLADAGRAAELQRLLADVESTFPADPALDLVQWVARQLAKAVGTGIEASRCFHESAATLRRSFRGRGYRVEALPFT